MRHLAAVFTLTALLPAAAAAVSAEFHGGKPPIIVIYENKTPWPLRITVDGRRAIESVDGRDLPPGSSAKRSLQPKQDPFGFGGSSVFFEAKVVVHRWTAEWILAKPEGVWIGFGDDLRGKHIVITFEEDDFKLFPWYRFAWENLANLATAAFLAMLAALFLLFSLCAARAVLKSRGPS